MPVHYNLLQSMLPEIFNGPVTVNLEPVLVFNFIKTKNCYKSSKLFVRIGLNLVFQRSSNSFYKRNCV